MSNRDDELVHRLKNHLSIILGFTELLLEDSPVNGTARGDLDEIRKAARVALAEMPELAKRLSGGVTQ